MELKPKGIVKIKAIIDQQDEETKSIEQQSTCQPKTSQQPKAPTEPSQTAELPVTRPDFLSKRFFFLYITNGMVWGSKVLHLQLSAIWLELPKAE
jgi:hypothetical protein